MKLSAQMEKDIRAAAFTCGRELKRCLEIGEFTSIRLSLHLSKDSTGRLCGVKFDVFKAETVTGVYDTDLGEE